MITCKFTRTIFFFNWMKLKFINACVSFWNCTNTFQQINVILQCLFKHAFKKESYSWTCSTIKTQLLKGKNLKVDFWMLILKPNTCAWIFMHGFMQRIWKK